MKKLLFLFFLSNFFYGYSQITKTPVAEKKEEKIIEPYDDTKNFLRDNPYAYIGQELYLNEKSEGLREYGYRDFVIDYTKGEYANNNIYRNKGNRGFSDYDEMAGKYFEVIDVIDHPQQKSNKSLYGNVYFLKLKEKESNDIVYFKYSSEFKYSFPFIVVAYFNKAKEIYIGEKYVLRGRNWIDSSEKMYSINNGNEVDFSAGTEWTCVDVSIEEKYYNLSLIIENDNKEQLAIAIPDIENPNTYFNFSKKDADNYQSKFGKENWDKILNGKVVVGFTEEMCLLSWGEPTTINRASYGDQWVYDEQYLYFKNGKLDSFN